MQIDNKVLKDHEGALAALIRCEEVRLLREKLQINLLPDGRNYRVDGISEELCARFSKRRADIVGKLQIVGKDSADNRALAEKIAYDTRQPKSHETAHVLRDMWRSELAEAGLKPEELLDKVYAAAKRLDHSTDLDRFNAARTEALAAIDAHAAKSGVFSYADFHRLAFEAMQCHGIGAVAALDIVQQMISHGDVVRVSSRERGPMFGTREMQEREREIIVKATSLRSVPFENEKIRRIVRRATERGATLIECTPMVLFLRKPGLAVFDHTEGSSGSESLSMICGALNSLGVTVIGAAATDQGLVTLQTSAGLPNKKCKRLDRILGYFAQSDGRLLSRFAIVVPDAEYVTLNDMLRLLSVCVDASAPLLLSGNLSVARLAGGGSPFKLLSRLKIPVAAQTVEEEERYKGSADAAWMNAAAIDLTLRKTSRALEACDRMGKIAWGQNRQQAMDSAIDAFVKHMHHLPGHSRAITTLWPKDAYAIRDAAREKLKKLEHIAPKEFVVMALPLGLSHDKPVSMPLSQGDEIVFGEDIAIAQRQIAKGQSAVVTRIANARSTELYLDLRLIGNEEPQDLFAVRYSDLVGSRERNVPSVPRIQHVYGLSAEASRDLEFDAVFDVALRPRGHHETRQACTRHRQSLRIFVDLGRLQDDRRAEAPTRTVHANRGLRFLPPEPVPRLNTDDLKRTFFAECDREQSCGNITDDIPREHLIDWVKGRLPVQDAVGSHLAPTDAYRLIPLPCLSDLRLTPDTLRMRIKQRVTAPEGYRSIWDLLAQNVKSEGGAGGTALLQNLAQHFKQMLEMALNGEPDAANAKKSLRSDADHDAKDSNPEPARADLMRS